jgi:hypothetical protein
MNTRRAYDPERMLALYHDGRSVLEIAAELGCCANLVRLRLRERGVRMAPPGRPVRLPGGKYTCKCGRSAMNPDGCGTCRAARRQREKGARKMGSPHRSSCRYGHTTA